MAVETDAPALKRGLSASLHRWPNHQHEESLFDVRCQVSLAESVLQNDMPEDDLTSAMFHALVSGEYAVVPVR